MILNSFRAVTRLATVAALACVGASGAFADAFAQTNLVSDVPGLAPITDPNLRNPWGVSFSATSPFWVSNQGSNNSTLYGANGAVQSLVVGVPGGPTGQVFTGGTGFQEPSGLAATFVFATLSGSIYAWNPGNGTNAQLVASTPASVYTGLALGTGASNNLLYAANARAGTIDVFDSRFNKTSVSGTFSDPTLPAGFSPYNVQNINGLLYVTYENRANEGAGQGVVNVFDLNGNLQKRLISTGGALDSPWGLVIAPASFGALANSLLVGNEDDGRINAFDPNTGNFLGSITDSNGQPIVNTGLWALVTRTGPGFDPNAVYFAAGINNEANGLLGRITPVPEPLPLGLFSLGLLGITAFRARGAFRGRKPF